MIILYLKAGAFRVVPILFEVGNSWNPFLFVKISLVILLNLEKLENDFK